MPVSRHYFIQHACVSPFNGHLTTVLLRLGVGLVPTAAAPSLQWFLLCSKPPSAACCTLFLARCERASLRRCPIGGARSVAYGGGARCMQAARACGLTCLSVQRVRTVWIGGAGCVPCCVSCVCCVCALRARVVSHVFCVPGVCVCCVCVCARVAKQPTPKK